MTRYDPRFCSKKRLQHLSIRDQAPPQKRSPSWYEVLQKTWARGWFLENQDGRLTPEQREEMLCSLTRDGTQAIPVRFRSMRAQQLVDILAARRSVWASEISLPKKLAKGLRKDPCSAQGHLGQRLPRGRAMGSSLTTGRGKGRKLGSGRTTVGTRREETNMVNLGELSPPPRMMSPKDILEIRTIAIRLAGMSVTAGQAGLWNASTCLAGHASVLLDFAACAVRLTVRHALVAGMSQLRIDARKRDDGLSGGDKEAKLLVRRAVEIVDSYLDAEPLCCATMSGA